MRPEKRAGLAGRRSAGSRKWAWILLGFASAGALTMAGALASGGPGSPADPLVTLSYLTDTFTPRLLEEVDRLLAGRLPPADGEGYAPVTLEPGQALQGEAGCAIVLQEGSAQTGVPLADATTGEILPAGAALERFHLYLLPEPGRVAAEDGAALLVRGRFQRE